MRCLILGGGPAGIAAAKAVRRMSKEAEIVLAGEEREGPYLRPFLPDLLAGSMDVAGLSDPQGSDLGELGIAVRRGAAAESVDTRERRVAFADGTKESYDRLVLATGGKPTAPAALRACPEAVVPFDSLGDALRIRERMGRPGPVAVYGPGYLAIVTATALRKAGREVVWFKPGEPRFGNPIGGELEASILDEVRNRGVRILDGIGIEAVRAAEGGFELTPSEGGERLVVPAVVLATERMPSTAYLRGSGIEVGTGILVDDYLRTNATDVYAAGDCAEVYDRVTHESRINFGWRSAIRQGELAGGNAAGGARLYIRNREDYFWLLFGAPLANRVREEAI